MIGTILMSIATLCYAGNTYFCLKDKDYIHGIMLGAYTVANIAFIINEIRKINNV